MCVCIYIYMGVWLSDMLESLLYNLLLFYYFELFLALFFVNVLC